MPVCGCAREYKCSQKCQIPWSYLVVVIHMMLVLGIELGPLQKQQVSQPSK